MKKPFICTAYLNNKINININDADFIVNFQFGNNFPPKQIFPKLVDFRYICKKELKMNLIGVSSVVSRHYIYELHIVADFPNDILKSLFKEYKEVQVLDIFIKDKEYYKYEIEFEKKLEEVKGDFDYIMTKNKFKRALVGKKIKQTYRGVALLK
jgi:hypothetical protein